MRDAFEPTDETRSQLAIGELATEWTRCEGRTSMPCHVAVANLNVLAQGEFACMLIAMDEERLRAPDANRVDVHHHSRKLHDGNYCSLNMIVALLRGF